MSILSYDFWILIFVVHVQILEGLLKLPENRECADCKAKYVCIEYLGYNNHRDSK